jgi:hypothetical protein
MRLSLKRGTGCQAYDAGVREDTLSAALQLRMGPERPDRP